MFLRFSDFQLVDVSDLRAAYNLNKYSINNFEVSKFYI
jgi:hypothetical protein